MIGQRNYSSNYGGSHPGDSLAFFAAIILIVILSLGAFASMD